MSQLAPLLEPLRLPPIRSLSLPQTNGGLTHQSQFQPPPAPPHLPSFLSRLSISDERCGSWPGSYQYNRSYAPSPTHELNLNQGPARQIIPYPSQLSRQLRSPEYRQDPPLPNKNHQQTSSLKDLTRESDEQAPLHTPPPGPCQPPAPALHISQPTRWEYRPFDQSNYPGQPSSQHSSPPSAEPCHDQPTEASKCPPPPLYVGSPKGPQLPRAAVSERESENVVDDTVEDCEPILEIIEQCKMIIDFARFYVRFSDPSRAPPPADVQEMTNHALGTIRIVWRLVGNMEVREKLSAKSACVPANKPAEKERTQSQVAIGSKRKAIALADHDGGSIQSQEISEKEGTKNNKRSRAAAELVICYSCATTSTPEWRRGPHGPRTLCNACGLQYSKKFNRQELVDALLGQYRGGHGIPGLQTTTLPRAK